MRDGRAGDVDLSGMGAVMATRYDDDEPGSPWTFFLYVDERGDAGQREALVAILTGARAGARCEHFPWAWKESHFLGWRPVGIEIDHTPGRGWFRAGGEVSRCAIRGPVGRPPAGDLRHPGARPRRHGGLYADLPPGRGGRRSRSSSERPLRLRVHVRVLVSGGADVRSPAAVAGRSAAPQPRCVTVAALLAVALVTWIVTIDRMRGMDAGPGTDLGGPGLVRRRLGDDDGGDDAALDGADGARRAAGVDTRAHPARRPPRSAATWLFVVGYLAAWTAYGLAAYGAVPASSARHPGFLAWDRGGPLVAGDRRSPPRASTSSPRSSGPACATAARRCTS